jgi:hypothetical protein
MSIKLAPHPLFPSKFSDDYRISVQCSTEHTSDITLEHFRIKATSSGQERTDGLQVLYVQRPSAVARLAGDQRPSHPVLPDDLPPPVLLQARGALALPRVDVRQSGQDVRTGDVLEVQVGIHLAPTHAQLHPEPRVLHDGRSHRTVLACISCNHG